MENNSSFKFKLIDVVPYTKDSKSYARVICYCSYGFLVTLFTTEEKAKLLKAKSVQPNFDMTNFVSVFYDNKANKFAYVINVK